MDQSSPGSSHYSLRSKKKQKKASLPAEFQFMPIMNNAMNLAADQIGKPKLKHL